MDEMQPMAAEKDRPKRALAGKFLENALFRSRYLALFAVLGSLVASVVLFLKGCLEIIRTCIAFWPELLHFQQAPADDKRVLVSVIPAIDYYLFAIVLLTFSMGVYELFVGEIVPQSWIDQASGERRLRPSWLNVKSVDELKTHVGKVVMMILIVNLFEQSFEIDYSKPSDLLFLGGALFLVAISLFTAHGLTRSSTIFEREKTAAREPEEE